ncbi:hypothetical protein [Lawsonibacter sp. JLR.KK007]|jgi:hypothetical protein|uniref:hypothetical protein n=1 Tax=Lawsonibacter sp. JLR.KK007 TaxID=3114293 RepID=UPI002FEEAF6E
MTYQELEQLLAPLGIPFTFHHWEKPPAMPYGVYFDDHTDNFAADGIAYAVFFHVNIELYVRQRDQGLEGRLEDILTAADLYWDKAAVYIDSERFYQVAYEIEV